MPCRIRGSGGSGISEQGKSLILNELDILIRCANGNVEQAVGEADLESQGNTGARDIHWEMLGRRWYLRP